MTLKLVFISLKFESDHIKNSDLCFNATVFLYYFL